MTSEEIKSKVDNLIKENRKNKSKLNTLITEMTIIDEAILLLQDSCPDHDIIKDYNCETCNWKIHA